MSLQPRWSEAILNGAKTTELRRNRAGCEPGTPVVIYTSYPVRRIEGLAKVASVKQASLDELWESEKETCGCSREEFDAYFHGASRGYAIRLTEVERLEPRELPFNGPQSYRYLFDDEEDQRQVLESVGLASSESED